MDPKSTKNQSKMKKKIDEKSSKIEVWRAPAQIWRPLGPSWAIKRILESILDRLEASRNRLKREKWPTWRQLGLKLAPKTEAKSVLSRPGGVWRASWRPHVADFMHFGCI